MLYARQDFETTSEKYMAVGDNRVATGLD